MPEAEGRGSGDRRPSTRHHQEGRKAGRRQTPAEGRPLAGAEPCTGPQARAWRAGLTALGPACGIYTPTNNVRGASRAPLLCRALLRLLCFGFGWIERAELEQRAVSRALDVARQEAL